MSTRSSVSTACSDSGDDDSAGMTTTGLMCSDRAEARRKLGGFCRRQKQRMSGAPFKMQQKKSSCEQLGPVWLDPHLRQLWNLDQPLEILQVTGAIKQTLYPAGERRKSHWGVWGGAQRHRHQKECVVLFKLLQEAISVALEGVWRKACQSTQHPFRSVSPSHCPSTHHRLGACVCVCVTHRNAA